MKARLAKICPLLPFTLLLTLLFASCQKKSAPYVAQSKTLVGLYPVDTRGDKEFTEDERNTIGRGNLIIKALDGFYSEHGHYPRRLSQLCPKYLPKIPKTLFKNEFIPLWHIPFIYRPYFNVENENQKWYTQPIEEMLISDDTIQNFRLRFRYDFDEDYGVSGNRRIWEYHLH